jgi:hypothetical protein
MPALVGRLGLAKLRAQFFEKRCGARHFIAADFQPLELGEKVAACQRGQPLQIILNPVGRRHCLQFSGLSPVSIRLRVDLAACALALSSEEQAGVTKK